MRQPINPSLIHVNHKNTVIREISHSSGVEHNQRLTQETVNGQRIYHYGNVSFSERHITGAYVEYVENVRNVYLSLRD